MINQNEQILKYLKEHGSITPREAYNELGIMRLAARIHDLRSTGVNIYTEEVTKPNRYGVKTRFARYVLNDEGN